MMSTTFNTWWDSFVWMSFMYGIFVFGVFFIAIPTFVIITSTIEYFLKIKR
jgi:hypothetical protein